MICEREDGDLHGSWQRTVRFVCDILRLLKNATSVASSMSFQGKVLLVTLLYRSKQDINGLSLTI